MQQISKYFNSNLTKIYKQSLMVDSLNQSIYKYLPKELHEHCKVGSFNQGRLLLITHNAAWASHIRFLIPELRDKLRQDEGLYQLVSIQLKILHQETIPLKETNKDSLLSEQARYLITDSAQQVKYLPLKEALEKLADRKK